MKKPIVSVILPTYNSAATLGRAVESVIAQTFSSWELIVVNDGSTDNTPQVIESCRTAAGDRLRMVWQPNGGPSVARNTGIECARGKYVCFLDADDEYLPTKLTRQVEFFERCPDLGLVFSDYGYADIEGRRHASVFDDLVPFVRQIPTEDAGPGLRVCGPELLDRMTGTYVVSTITGMVKRDLLGKDVRFPQGFLYCEEWLFFLEVTRRARGGYVDEALSLHHHTPGSVSRTSAIRNNTHRIKALEHVRNRFPAASDRAKAELNAQLVQSCRQLGMDHFKLKRYDEARDYFRKALGLRFDLRGVCNFAESAIKHKLQRFRSAPPRTA